MQDEYREWVADALLDRDDRDEWERMRAADLGLDAPRPTRAQMIEAFAAERRAVERAAAEAWDGERRGWRIGEQRAQDAIAACEHTWRFSNSRDLFVCTTCGALDEAREGAA